MVDSSSYSCGNKSCQQKSPQHGDSHKYVTGFLDNMVLLS
uniref:Uncharacterized protein n=1 Tax=Arundo donax TaxID=35708 RepID=A0A0A9FAU0_ARUDO